jgi:hypothetical protein
MDVSIPISGETPVNEMNNLQQVSLESLVSDSPLSVTGNLHGSYCHLSANPAKSNIKMLSALDLLLMDFPISLPVSGRNKFQSL